MKIICVASYCAGGLMCDLLNETKSPFTASIVQTRFNHVLKSPLTNRWNGNNEEVPYLILPIHEKQWLDLTTNLISKEWTQGNWFAHHQPVSIIPNIEDFEEVIHVTVTTIKSRWLRFLRHYWLEVNRQKMIQDHALDTVKDMINIIKYDPSWLPSEDARVTNVEFEDIVSGVWSKNNKHDLDHLNNWKKKNDFILDDFEQDAKLIELWETQEYYRIDPSWADERNPQHEIWEKQTIKRMNDYYESGQINA